ncbi:TetR/AcrR family transcriptional regulator [Brevibacterium atlanticum]|uniref:TetR/AcrR family transcriptional regulator n=1 Tax=Brevibacterium atlanticum TaxID=2697563 RepID=UPI001422FACE|nr:TetR/AcrR family transcriptional regulator [Brevibacterium atlanticum]
MSPRPQQPPEQVEAKKSAIIEATLDAIIDRGPAAVRLADVASTVGLSVGTVQYYFVSRDELLVQAFTAHSDAVLAGIDELARTGELARADEHACTGERAAKGSARRQLADSLAAVSSVGDYQRRSEIWIELVAAARHNPALQGCVDAVNDGWRRHFTSIIDLGVADREFAGHDLPVPAIVDAIIALIDGFDLAMVTGRGKGSRELTRVLSQTVVGLVGSH